MRIKKVAVIGAGVMGAGIAAHISNAGVAVYLLDVVPKSGADNNRNVIADTAVKKLLAASPAAFMHKKNARLISTGNIEDDLALLTQVDWVIEAVVENLASKQKLYRQLEKICPPQTLISSNTSTIPLRQLMEGFAVEFQRRFIITHFFNPPRYMRLLELVSSPHTDQELFDSVKLFADIQLGKGCVECKDTSGFIANRIGIYWLQCSLLEAFKQKMQVEQVDVVMSALLGIPKTGIFGLLDLIGLDLIPHIMESMRQLPKDDAFYAIDQTPELFTQMIADGYIGRKGKGGFYRLNTSNGKRVKESINLSSGEYSKSERPHLACLKVIEQQGLLAFLSLDDKNSQYAWTVIAKTMLYVGSLVPEVSDDIAAIDEAMCLGYNWQQGPFALLDKIGVSWFVKKAEQQGLAVPKLINAAAFYKKNSAALECRTLAGGYQKLKRATGVLLLADSKLQKPVVLTNKSASLWDVGDGVACFEIHSKMNTFDRDILDLLRASLDLVERDFKALVIHNEADNFSAGANLMLLTSAIDKANWKGVEDLVKQGQQAFMAVKYAPFPVVAAPTGLAIGGGCEILLHCDAIQAHAELYTGLVEVGVGLVPAWGGCKEYISRCLRLKKVGGPIPPVVKAFETIATATVSKSASEAKAALFLAPTDGITMNKNRLLADAKAKALALSETYSVPPAMEYKLPRKTAQVLLNMAVKGLRMVGKVSDYDVRVASSLATVLSGGSGDMLSPLSEQDLLDLECQVFTELAQQEGTLARLNHMLKTGKPLRN